MKLKEEYRNNTGDWALVTGAASGIGFVIAEKLASRGYNLALADINEDGLHKAEAGLRERYKVHVKGMQIDLARKESAGRLHDWCVEEMIAPAILVNNAGIFSYNDILNTDTDRIGTMVCLHVLTVSMLCRLFGEDMAKRGRGYILNMSSYSMWMPWPGLAVYSATKSYIRNFSRSLAAEVKDRGVIVTAVLPAGVTTDLYGLSPKLQSLGKKLGVLLTPEHTAEVALAAMFKGRKQYIPGFLMRLMLPLVKNLPGWAVRIARRKTLKFQK